ncbi:hypothetical protein [Moorena producens]|nr:hypothetical protein [Moorena producens]
MRKLGATPYSLLPTPYSLLPKTTVVHLIQNCYTQPAISIS